uniref:DUF3741 domain-containing protein n=1 Tax=Kalanchoe fedtschenkoi TaxID=63787 RepID=A0A7N0THI2_KALFE
MASLSLFQAKNTIGSKMKRSIINFCSGDDSTSTLNQQQQHQHVAAATSAVSTSQHKMVADSPLSGHAMVNETPPKRKVTLEEMILQLELEEETARKEKLRDIMMQQPGRRSCVNNSDILRSARNALNQYPRFSLDGRDAMYRNFNHISPIPPVRGRRNHCLRGCDDVELGRRLPASLGGERVAWCKPGVVARLMGLDAMPVPVFASRFCSREKLRCMMKRQSLRQMAERRENERRTRVVMELGGGCRGRRSVGLSSGSCSRTGEYVVQNPVAGLQPEADRGANVRMKRYR